MERQDPMVRAAQASCTKNIKLEKRSLIGALLLFFLCACNMQAEKNQYILGERLFTDQKYTAAVAEFEKIVDKNPRSAMAQQSLYRMGVIQSLYTEQYDDAVKSFRQFSLLSSNKELVFEAEKNIAEIFFSKKEDFRAAAVQYKAILDKYPTTKDRPFFLFRLSKSYYGALDFKSAIVSYQLLIQEFPKNDLIPEAQYQIGNTLFTEGDCNAAIKKFEEVIKTYPSSPQVVFAKFGMGNCYEETDRPDQALAIYESIVDQHPAKAILETKIKRLKEKKHDKKHS